MGNNPTFTNVSRKDGSSVPVCNFSLASSDYKRTVDDAGHVKFDQIGETVWFDCRLWGAKAEKLTKTLQKGMPVVVLSCSISLRKTEKDGQEYKNLVVDADDVLVSLLANRVEEVKLRPAKEGDAPDTANTASESDMPF